MIFRQLFDSLSSTYTYIISSGKGREALIIDPVLEKTDQYIKLLKGNKSKTIYNSIIALHGAYNLIEYVSEKDISKLFISG